MTAEAKLRTLAQQDANLQAYFFTDGQVRWFDEQLQPNYLKLGKSAAVVCRVSTVRQYAHETRTRRSEVRQTQPRFQIDVLDFDSERARSAAKAVIDWLAVVDFSSNAQFASPPTSPTRHPNFVLNQRNGIKYRLAPTATVITLDIRIFNLEEE